MSALAGTLKRTGSNLAKSNSDLIEPSPDRKKAKTKAGSNTIDIWATLGIPVYGGEPPSGDEGSGDVDETPEDPIVIDRTSKGPVVVPSAPHSSTSSVSPKPPAVEVDMADANTEVTDDNSVAVDQDPNSPTKPINLSTSSLREAATSTQAQSKPRKEEKAWTKQCPEGVIKYRAYDEPNLSENVLDELRKLKITPLGKITEYALTVPHNSERNAGKSLINSTGRKQLTIFRYTFVDPNYGETYTVMWDYQIGLVRITPFFQVAKKGKGSPGTALKDNVGLHPVCFNITGGSVSYQGYWVPFAAAKELLASFCYKFRYALVPLFGQEFPEMCIKPEEEKFGNFLVSIETIEKCIEEANILKNKPSKSRDQASATSVASVSPAASVASATPPTQVVDRNVSKAPMPAAFTPVNRQRRQVQSPGISTSSNTTGLGVLGIHFAKPPLRGIDRFTREPSTVSVARVAPAPYTASVPNPAVASAPAVAPAPSAPAVNPASVVLGDLSRFRNLPHLAGQDPQRPVIHTRAISQGQIPARSPMVQPQQFGNPNQPVHRPAPTQQPPHNFHNQLVQRNPAINTGSISLERIKQALDSNQIIIVDRSEFEKSQLQISMQQHQIAMHRQSQQQQQQNYFRSQQMAQPVYNNQPNISPAQQSTFMDPGSFSTPMPAQGQHGEPSFPIRPPPQQNFQTYLPVNQFQPPGMSAGDVANTLFGPQTAQYAPVSGQQRVTTVSNPEGAQTPTITGHIRQVFSIDSDED